MQLAVRIISNKHGKRGDREASAQLERGSEPWCFETREAERERERERERASA